jgi:hypothetical protein
MELGTSLGTTANPFFDTPFTAGKAFYQVRTVTP